MEWKNVGSPGYLGKRRDEWFAKWSEQYGGGNWRLVWLINDNAFDFLGVCALYEDAYFSFFQANPKIVEQLITVAANIYDDETSNISSALDYTRQETKRTHIQDIAIRRCIVRLGLKFLGDEFIRIRQEQGNHPLSMILSPGNVPFHKPEWILQPELTGWWKEHSVEAFYQTNRVLQIKE